MKLKEYETNVKNMDTFSSKLMYTKDMTEYQGPKCKTTIKET